MNERIRGIVICVGYDDLLMITLVRNMRFLQDCLVVTSPDDVRTQKLGSSVIGSRVFVTDAFYRNGAKFNKGLAMEESFDYLGREGWILTWDADTLFPDEMQLPKLVVGNLYNPPRRILNDPRQWHPAFDWNEARPHRDHVFPGYFHLFHAKDQALRQRPWYDVTFSHAGGGDGYFQSRWSSERKVRLPFEVLHLGPKDSNWFGRATDRIDGTEQSRSLQETAAKDMQMYKMYKGWDRSHPRLPSFQEHVEVDGHKPTGFEVR